MTEAEATKKLSEMLPRLYAWRLEIDRIEKTPLKNRTQPFPPATDAEIAAAEARMKLKFPPSYRAFLKLHNGWKNLNYQWWVFGASGVGLSLPEKAWTSACAAFEKRCLKKGKPYVEGLRSKAKTDPDVMYWPDHAPCATDFQGGFMVFDRNRPAGGAEYEIAEVAREEEAANRLPDFVAYVDMIMDIMRDALTEHGRKPNAITPVQPNTTPGEPGTRGKSTKSSKGSKTTKGGGR
jgi:cell wall assembly regulator SMI1